MSTGRVRVAAYLVAIDRGAILLSRIAPEYPGAGSWTLPGGGVEWGEHPEQTLRREVYEEAGLAPDEVRFLGIDSMVHGASGEHDGVHAIRILYRAEVQGTPRVTEMGGSVDAAAWVRIVDLAVTPTVHLVSAALSYLDESDGGDRRR